MYKMNKIGKTISFENKIDITLGLIHMNINIFDQCSYFASNRELNTIDDYKDYENYRTIRAKCILNNDSIDKMINLLSFQNYEFHGTKKELFNWLQENGINIPIKDLWLLFEYGRKKRK